jgi:SAM-dependent methyltransferase
MGGTMSDIPREFDASWYDYYYFADPRGKAFRRANGSIEYWGYRNLEGWWDGAVPIAKAWKTMFNPRNMLDIGCGRGAFTLAARNEGIEAYGFDFSEYAINNLCPGCRREWFRVWDATETPWPYGDKSFDLVVCLDCLEHLYSEDIPKVVDEMYRVARKWVFLQIAVVGGGSGPGRHERGYVLRRGEPIPIGLEGNAVAGHVTVVSEDQWYEWLDRDEWLPRRDMVEWFYLLTPEEVTVNWRQNLVVVMERV